MQPLYMTGTSHRAQLGSVDLTPPADFAPFAAALASIAAGLRPWGRS